MFGLEDELYEKNKILLKKLEILKRKNKLLKKSNNLLASNILKNTKLLRYNALIGSIRILKDKLKKNKENYNV